MGELRVRVTPRASREKIEVEDGLIKIWVMASPTDGEANEAVCRRLAKALAIAPSTVSLVRGHSSREKVIEVPMETAEAVAKLST